MISARAWHIGLLACAMMVPAAAEAGWRDRAYVEEGWYGEPPPVVIYPPVVRRHGPAIYMPYEVAPADPTQSYYDYDDPDYAGPPPAYVGRPHYDRSWRPVPPRGIEASLPLDGADAAPAPARPRIVPSVAPKRVAPAPKPRVSSLAPAPAPAPAVKPAVPAPQAPAGGGARIVAAPQAAAQPAPAKMAQVTPLPVPRPNLESMDFAPVPPAGPAPTEARH